MPKSAPAKGFTLVELLVVISIIAILSVIGMVVFTNVQKGARDSKRRADLHAISLALEQYKGKNGTYPATGGWVYSDGTGNPWLVGRDGPGLDSNYMVAVPKDPKNTGGPAYDGGYTYGYYTYDAYGGTNGSYFMLIAHLESANSADKRTKCTFPNGATFGSTDTGASSIYVDNFFVCNQQ